MNFYTLASKMNRQIQKDADRLCKQFGVKAEDMEGYHSWHEKAKVLAKAEFKANAELGIELMLQFKQIALEKGLYGDNDKLKGHYFITIRPDEKSVSFIDFFNDVQKFVRRKCFIEYKLTFEQKGTTPETYGQGFHAHIIANCKQRSKTEVLRDTQSTFKNYTSANCIEVVILKTKKDLEGVTNYITLYTSDDDHKEVTQAADAEWRSQLQLSTLYTGSIEDPSALPSIKSVVGQGEITQGCYIVQMD